MICVVIKMVKRTVLVVRANQRKVWYKCLQRRQTTVFHLYQIGALTKNGIIILPNRKKIF